MRWDIQALRALAVISVVIYHIWPTRLEGGFMGVDIFFVISGYLMTLTIWKGVVAVRKNTKKKAKESIEFLFKFYARRIKRLAPAATACLIAVLIAVLTLGNYGIQQQTAQQTLMSTIFLQNWQLAGEAVDYLGADNAPTAVQHFWSLSIEEQFYMIWPLLLLIMGLVGIFIVAKSRKKNTKWLGKNFQAIIITLFTIATFIYGYWLTQTDPAAAYFVTPARIWELILGGIIVFLPKIKNNELKLLLPWFGLALCAYALMKWNGVGFPGWHALAPTLGTALIIWAGSSKKVEGKFSIQNLSKFRPAQFFGDISYSLYLWHWPLIILLPMFLDTNMSQSSLLKIIILIVSIVLAWLSYRFIESTTRKWQLSNAKTWIMGICCLTLVVVSSIIIRDNADYKINSVYGVVYEKAISDDICFGAKSTQHQAECESFGYIDSEYTQFATTTYMATADNQNFAATCNNDKNSPNDVFCEFGNTESNKTVLILGDSFSKQWYPAFDIVGNNLNYKVVGASTITCNGGLSELNKKNFKTTMSRSTENCNDRYNWIKDNLWQDADEVILTISSDQFIRNKGKNNNWKILAKSINRTIQTLNKDYNITPILVQSTPTIDRIGSPDEIQRCMTNKNCLTNKQEQLYYMDLVYKELKKDSTTQNFKYIQVQDLFCDDENCHTQIGGLPVFYNKTHINSMFSASTEDYFTKQLSNIWKLK